MNVLLVTSWGAHCGIFAHSAYLKEAVEAADPSITITPSCQRLPAPRGLDPAFLRDMAASIDADVVHLNYHFGLHSQWTPDVIASWQQTAPVVVTLHDTRGEYAPDNRTKALYDVASAFVVHEPCLGLEKAHYWRMGVPELLAYEGETSPYLRVRPIVGTVGHDFPWKCWPDLAATAASVGWGVLIYTPEMSAENEALLHRANPWVTVRRGVSSEHVLAGLSTCDATAFTFSCSNTGQSASILLGIGARKPVLAFEECRQNRALKLDAQGSRAIDWCKDFYEVAQTLRLLRLSRFDARIVALAETESWRHVGARYASLYTELVNRA